MKVSVWVKSRAGGGGGGFRYIGKEMRLCSELHSPCRGRYANLCGGCQEKNVTQAMYKGDVAAITQYGYDGVKIDGCGAEDDMGICGGIYGV